MFVPLFQKPDEEVGLIGIGQKDFAVDESAADAVAVAIKSGELQVSEVFEGEFHELSEDFEIVEAF